jgi:hypothetical protein
MEDQVQWTAPAPLWPEAAGAAQENVRRALQQPAILRFNSDSFMDEFMTMLEADPSRLDGYLAQPETWRGPAPSPEPVTPLPAFLRKMKRLRDTASRQLEQTSTTALAKQQSVFTALAAPAGTGGTTAQLKLYQPAHQRYYLVTGCLVCRRAGLPDRALDTNRAESASYVIRRLRPNANNPAQQPDELAFVTTPQGNGWQKLNGPVDLPLDNEERLPLFVVQFMENDGRRRRLYAGMIPVGKREAYTGACEISSAPGQNGSGTKKTARKIHFRMTVAEPWKSLLERADSTAKILVESQTAEEPPTAEDTRTLIRNSREQMQTMSWYVMLDMARYFAKYLPNVWSVVRGNKTPSSLANQAEKNLYNALLAMTVPGALKSALTDPGDPDKSPLYTPQSVASSLRDALRQISDPGLGWEQKLEQVSVSYNRKTPDALYPTFLFPFADPVETPPLPPASIDPPPTPADESGEAFELDPGNASATLVERQARVDKLVALVVRALPAVSGEPTPPPPLAAQPVLDARDAQFVIRCLYERPLCGPLEPPVMSEPSHVFQMAGFFDPDAPARPIRIALPIDTTPAGLSKFDRNTAFMISDALCGQIQRMKGITFGDLVLSVLPWPFHKDLSAKVPEMKPCATGGGIELGMICTLSIPIITICALLLLMIIVLLFDFIFKWVPFFIMCFPFPKFKAKG